MVSFTVASAVTMPAKEIPANVLGYLLERNSHCIVAWHVSIGDDGSAVFGVNYRALTPGLNPGVFRMLCQMLLQEASEFDDRMRKAGVLQ